MDVTSTSPNDPSLDDEPFELALSRLTAAMARTLSSLEHPSSLGSIRRSQPSPDYVVPKERKVNLRFPTPADLGDEEEVSDEEREFGKITFARVGDTDAASEELNLRIERLSMQLEDLTSISLAKLCTVVPSTQPLTLTDPDISSLESTLRKLRSDRFALIPLGPILFQAYYRPQSDDSPSDSLSFQENQLSDYGGTESAEDCDSRRLPAGRADDEGVRVWTEKCEEIQKAWSRMKEERLELRLIEQFLAEKERSIQLQTVTLTRLQRDFDSSRHSHEARTREQYFQILFLKGQAESLLQTHISTQFSLNPAPKLSLSANKRLFFEGELDKIRSEIDSTPDIIDSDLSIALQAAEEAFLTYLSTGDESKLSVRLESLKNKVLSTRISAALLRTQRKTDSINSTIEAMGMTPQLIRARNNIRTSVLQRCSTRPGSPARAAVRKRAVEVGNDQLAGEREPFGGEFTPGVGWQSPKSPPDTLFTTNQSSIKEELSDLSFGDKEDDYKRGQLAVKAYEKQIGRWKTVISSLKEKVKELELNERFQQEAKIRLKAREKRLLSLESSLKSQKSSLKSREKAISLREDELFSPKVPFAMGDIRELAKKSAVKVQEQIHHIESQMEEMVALSIEMSAEKGAIEEARKALDKEKALIEREKTGLETEQERLEVVEKGMKRLFGKMLEVVEGG